MLNIEERLYKEFLDLFAGHQMLKRIYNDLRVVRSRREEGVESELIEERNKVLEGAD